MGRATRQFSGGVLHAGGTRCGTGDARSLASTFPNKLVRLLLALLYALVALLMLNASAYGATWYVDSSRPDDSGDGTSWITAEKTIQAAITDAGAGGEIWVAAGTYTGVTDTVVTMAENVHLYGGFDKAEATRAERDWSTNETIIDGEDTRRGVIGASNATLDGFTITRGYTTGAGGGMYNESSSPTVTNCTFAGNSAFTGGGMYIASSAATVTNCTFTGNSAFRGGGILNIGGSPTLTNCTFTGNSASTDGGGMYNTFGSPTVTNCMFTGNSASIDGGGMNNISSSSPTLINCIFTENSASDRGGGMLNAISSSPTLTNCTFTGNSASSNGGTMYNQNSSTPTLTNCISWNNSPGEIVNEDGSSIAVVTFSIVQGGYAGTGNVDLDPQFSNATTGDLILRYNSPAIDAGTATGAPVADIEGNPRPVDIPGVGTEGAGAVDMGAYEMPLVVYVDKDNAGAEDGETWATAYDTIQEGIDAAFAASGGDVWVAEGVYDEARTSSPQGEGTGNIGSIIMKANVHLYGGFVGTETAGSQRDWETHVTTLDGATARGGLPAYHVIVGASNGTLDGFTVTGGAADYVTGVTNDYRQYGGGMFNGNSSSPIVANCTFAANNAIKGGGMYNRDSSSPTVANCTFTANTASGSTANRGGGMYNYSLSSPVVTNCRFFNNEARHGGGGMLNDSSSPTVTNCVFSENSNVTNSDSGGGMFNISNSTPLLTNCTFSANWATQGAGGIQNWSSSPTLTNCILWDNSPAQMAGGTPTVTYSIVQGGFTGAGNLDGDPFFVDAGNADLRLRSISPAIDAGTSVGAPSTDFDGNPRPFGPGIDIGAYEFQGSAQDIDGDGLPDLDEVSQGLDEFVHDAALFATLDFPSDGSSFRSIHAPILLSGRLSSSFIDAVVISSDGGATFDKVANITGLTWSFSWTPPALSGTPYSVIVKAGNVFGGFTTTGPIDVTYSDGPPHAVITSPVANEHLRSVITITGSAMGGQLGFGNYTAHYGVGSDVGSVSVWNAMQGSPFGSPVSSGTLVPSWDVTGLVDGDYMLRLVVTDGSAVLSSTTYVPVVVDNDFAAPAAPSSLTVAGQLLPGVVADSKLVDIQGLADPGSRAFEAQVVDAATLVSLKDVTDDVTIHLNGAIRGTFTLPGGITAAQIGLRLRVQDALGNVSVWTLSNLLTVDNDAPSVTIVYPPSSTTAPFEAINVSGNATDVGAAGIDLVEFSIDNSTWTTATGTTSWSHNWVPPSEATYTLYARATDFMGNAATTTSSNVTINSTNPTAIITYPVNGQSINSGANITVVGTAKDTTDFNWYKLQYIPPSGPAVDVTGQIGTPKIAEPLGSWNTTGLDQGTHTLRLIVLDDAFNITNFDLEVEILAELSLTGVPDGDLAEDAFINDFVHLPDFASALVGDVETMTYTVVNFSDPNVINAGVFLDSADNVDIYPLPDWSGSASVTVRVDNGSGLTNDDTFVVTVLPVNDAPTAPVVSISPATPLNGDNLVVSIDVPSVDVEGSPITYGYAWFESSDGVVFAPTGNSSSSLSNTLTAEGDFWKCEVTPNDGTTDGNIGAAVVRVVQPGGISLTVTPSEVALGTIVTLSGGISPNESDSQGRPVFFGGTIAPSGGELPTSTSTDGSAEYTQTFLPDRAGTWFFESDWAGFGGLSAGTSGQRPATVLKAQPTVSLLLSQTSAGMSFTGLSVDVTFDTVLPVELVGLKDGRPIELTVLDSSGSTIDTRNENTNASGVATFTTFNFDTAGTFQFVAKYTEESNGSFLTASSPPFGDPETPRLTIKNGAGYAVLVVGALDDDFANNLGEGQVEHTKTMDYVYRSFRARGFAQNEIYYLREAPTLPPDIELRDDPDTTGRGTTAPTTPTSKTDVINAITVWARDKMNAPPAPLYLVMADHGLENKFYVYSDSFDPADRIITPGDLDSYLTTLEGSLDGEFGDGTPDEAADQDLVTILGACYSGSFIPSVRAANRIVITSARDDQLSYRGALDPQDSIRDGELFLTELFRELRQGTNLKAAFETASLRIADFTLTSSNSGDVNASPAQEPLLNDSGASNGSTAEELSFAPGFDGARAFGLVLGFGANSGGAAGWFSSTQTLSLLSGAPMAQLYATATAFDASNEAWIEVKEPTYTDGTPVDEGTSSGGEDYALFQQKVDMEIFDFVPGLLEEVAAALSAQFVALDGNTSSSLDATEVQSATGLGPWTLVQSGLTQANFDLLDISPADSSLSASEVLGASLVFGLLDLDGDSGLLNTEVAPEVYRWSSFNAPKSRIVDLSGDTPFEDVFSAFGTYQVYYFLRNGTTDDNETSAQVLTTVFREQPGNKPPSAVNLLSPADTAVLNVTTAFLAWSGSVDPDADAVTYRAEVDTANTFDTGNLIVKEGLTSTFAAIGNLQDSETYFWRVIAVDEYGAQSSPNAVRSFSIDAQNPVNKGSVGVAIREAGTGAYVTGATVDATKEGETTPINGAEQGDGIYAFLNLESAIYTVEVVSVPGFATPLAQSGIAVTEGDWTNVLFVVGDGDADGDGLTDREEDQNGNGLVDEGETDWNDWDSDDDGFSDGLEIDDGTDPNNSGSNLPKSQAWVEIDRSGVLKGTLAEPVSALSEALPLITPGGTITFVNAGNNPDGAPIILTTPTTIEATGGTVVFGVAARSSASRAQIADDLASGTGDIAALSGGIDHLGSSTHGNTDSGGQDTSIPIILDKLIYEPVLPYTKADATAYAATFDTRLSLRLRADEAIDLQSLWADITGYGAETSDITWTSADGERNADLWVHFTARDGWYLEEWIEALSGAVTLNGDPIVSDYAQFLIDNETEAEISNTESERIVWQPDTGDDTGRVTVIADAPGHPELDSAPGPIYTIRPESVYDEPQRVWLPLPYGADPNTIGIYYYHPNGNDHGWYPAENVLGWLVPDTTLTLDFDGVDYLGLLVRHAAIIHVGEPVSK